MPSLSYLKQVWSLRFEKAKAIEHRFRASSDTCLLVSELAIANAHVYYNRSICWLLSIIPLTIPSGFIKKQSYK